MRWIVLKFFAITAQAADTTVYVHSVKAQLKDQPKFNGKNILVLKRGQKLTRIAKKGIWIEVKTEDGTTGFVSKLFVKNKAPIGQAELFETKGASQAKTSRRRSSSYAVSAATRGLTANMRVRGEREMYRSNPEALKRMEDYSVSSKQLESFEKYSNRKRQ